MLPKKIHKRNKKMKITYKLYPNSVATCVQKKRIKWQRN